MSTLRVAIIGAGPAGLYAAVELLAKNNTARVDIYDRLPTPGGLARSGVSPDHGQRRKVMEVYETIALASGRYFFHGNVEIGKDITHQQLLKRHHAVIYACGAANDRSLGIDGEQLGGCHAATEFVAWYNGHPDYADRQFDLSGDRAIIIGNGNVALDVARMLLLGKERLATTDIADYALEALSKSKIKEVLIVGRRGIKQAAFTLPELLELEALEDIAIEFESADFSALAYEDAIADSNQLFRLKTFKKYADKIQSQREKRLVFKFLASPKSITASTSNSVAQVTFCQNQLIAGEDGRLQAVSTDRLEAIDASLVIRAVGYRGQAISGLPFDDSRGLMPNINGRVTTENNLIEPFTYVVGWLKRGPSGVLGTNKMCSKQTVNALLEDWQSGVLARSAIDDSSITDYLIEQHIQAVSTKAWKKIDAAEKSAGLSQGRPRVKITAYDKLLSTALSS